MNEIDVCFIGVREPAWARGVSSLCDKILDLLDIDEWEVSLLICDDAKMRELNRRYRGQDRSTDVLSFEQGPDPSKGRSTDPSGRPDPSVHPPTTFPAGLARNLAGDIVLSAERLEEQARSYGVTDEEELKRLLVHGILHLSGMDHEGNDDMCALEIKIMRELNEESVF